MEPPVQHPLRYIPFPVHIHNRMGTDKREPFYNLPLPSLNGPSLPEAQSTEANFKAQPSGSTRKAEYTLVFMESSLRAKTYPQSRWIPWIINI